MQDGRVDCDQYGARFERDLVTSLQGEARSPTILQIHFAERYALGDTLRDLDGEPDGDPDGDPGEDPLG